MRKVKEIRVDFTNLFNQQRKNAPLEIKTAFLEAFELFLENPNHIALRNHVLTGKYSGIHSIDVTEDWRVLYKVEPDRIIFVELGTHEELYGKS